MTVTKSYFQKCILMLLTLNRRMREGLKWKAHSHEVRVARTWNAKPDPQGHAPKSHITLSLALKMFLCFVAVNVTVAYAQPDSLITAKEFSPRGGLPNFYAKINTGKPVKIAFLGGSITRAGNGYRDQILTWFKNQYSATRFEEIMAAVSGTGSDFGACRVRKQVIDHQPDLVFIEFAVNDNRMLMQLVRETMEGIVRQIWKGNKHTDICFIYTFAAENLPLLQKDTFPPSVSAMETVAAHYNIPSIHMGLAVIDTIQAGKLLMSGKREDVSNIPLFSIDGVHPLPETGHKIYTQVLSRVCCLCGPHASENFLTPAQA